VKNFFVTEGAAGGVAVKKGEERKKADLAEASGGFSGGRGSVFGRRFWHRAAVERAA